MTLGLTGRLLPPAHNTRHIRRDRRGVGFPTFTLNIPMGKYPVFIVIETLVRDPLDMIGPSVLTNRLSIKFLCWTGRPGKPLGIYTMASIGDKDVSQQIEHASSNGSTKNKAAEADLLQARQLAAQWVNDRPDERKLVRKLDWRILPCTWVLYLLGYLDRWACAVRHST